MKKNCNKMQINFFKEKNIRQKLTRKLLKINTCLNFLWSGIAVCRLECNEATFFGNWMSVTFVA